MNLREIYEHLLRGGRVNDSNGEVFFMDEDGKIRNLENDFLGAKFNPDAAYWPYHRKVKKTLELSVILRNGRVYVFDKDEEAIIFAKREQDIMVKVRGDYEE